MATSRGSWLRADESRCPYPRDCVVYSGFQATPRITQQASLVTLLKQWNFVVPRESCCQHHASLFNLQTIAKVLTAEPCHPNCSEVLCQCAGCAMVDCLDEGVCMHCGVEASPGLMLL